MDQLSRYSGKDEAMNDYTDLQKAAEYAAQDTIKFADESEEMRALQQFHEEVDPEVVLSLIADLDRNQRMLLAACMEMGAIGNALNADMNDDGDALLGMVVELKAERDRLREDRDGLLEAGAHLL